MVGKEGVPRLYSWQPGHFHLPAQFHSITPTKAHALCMVSDCNILAILTAEKGVLERGEREGGGVSTIWSKHLECAWIASMQRRSTWMHSQDHHGAGGDRIRGVVREAGACANLSSTQGRSMRMPFTESLPYDRQLASISPRPPPTSIMQPLLLQSYASLRGTSPPVRLSRVKLVMAFWKSSANASCPSSSSYCRMQGESQ